MKKILQIPTEQMHRAIVAFLLEEAKKNYQFISRKPGLEESLLRELAEENKRHLDPDFLSIVDNSHWWRRVLRAIEDCGLNSYTFARVLTGKEKDTDPDICMCCGQKIGPNHD